MRSVIEMPREPRRFSGDERGNVGIIFGVALLPLMFFAGAATDYGRALNARSVLQAAADAAVVAAANSSGDSDAKRRIAADVFTANASANGINITAPTLAAPSQGSTSGGYTFSTETAFGTASTSISVATTGITVTPTVNVPTTFMRLAGIESIPVSTASLATGSTKKLEVAMMIDLTGSMGWNDKGSPAKPKIDGLKTAAADFLNILFPSGATFSNSTRVAIVPFADYVNAGDYASAVTGLPSTGNASNGGLYSKKTNLKQTKNGAFSGTYAGTFSSMTSTQIAASGGQAGAQSPYQLSGTSAPTNSSGATYTSSHCSTPAAPTTATLKKDSDDRPYGVRVELEDNPSLTNYPYLTKGSDQTYRRFELDRTYNGAPVWDEDSTSNDEAFVKVPTSATGLTLVPNRTANWSGSSKTGPVGVKVYCNDGDCPNAAPSNSTIVRLTSGGYWRLKKLDRNTYNNTISEDWEWESASNSSPNFYLPLYQSYNTGAAADPNCTSEVDQPNGKVISCVTERKGTNAYTDAVPSGTSNSPNTGDWIGSYNQVASGSTNKENYSEDGKCYVAGRELPKVIPLTNQKQPLTDFFNSMTVGGATPGHIGTAWAWYMLAPDWNSIFSLSTPPAAYNNDQVIKAAVLMTDGEYNVHYASAAAATQALALCTAMKEKGIKVYTIGFGFGVTSSQDSTSEANARSLLTSCSSGTNTYFFPYDSDTLKQAFTTIGNQLNSLALNQIKVSQ